jgi:hypothetical protein
MIEKSRMKNTHNRTYVVQLQRHARGSAASHQRRVLGGSPPQHEWHLGLRQQRDHRWGLQPRLTVHLRRLSADGTSVSMYGKWMELGLEYARLIPAVDRKVLKPESG